MPQLIDEFEHLMEHTLEDRLFAWLPEQISVKNTVYQILAAVAALHEIAPETALRGDFLILVAPQDYPLWFANQVDLVNFSRVLVSVCQQIGYHLDKPPAFHIMSDQKMASGGIDIRPVRAEADKGETQYLGIIPAAEKQSSTVSKSAAPEIQAFLTTNQNDIYQITKSVTNIGRREDNDIVIQDQRVSRQHAQIRRGHQHYLIFDLNSTGGTWVNNNRITQAELNSGDVISIAGNVLIYAEELVNPADEDEETNDLNGTTSTPHDQTGRPIGEDIL
jgi:pSer/pThr/pTyr-binding forkhead associated (FHA) protein